ncbi:hypothetical protein AB0J38_27320 [Streptomyces sp. NPDC050095]|uniref:hypothetical protein n=1 Tax=unclassified Streptomyces TaxID=2593676 RepID=UPI00341C6DD9
MNLEERNDPDLASANRRVESFARRLAAMAFFMATLVLAAGIKGEFSWVGTALAVTCAGGAAYGLRCVRRNRQ